jgi:CubicO group peptidase (beta-lactamase class C family)
MTPKCPMVLRLAIIFIFTSSSVFAPPCAVAQVKPTAQTKSQPDYSPLISELKEKIPQMMAQKNVPGLAVALIDGEKLVWAEGFGFTDNSKKARVTADTLFSLMSVSKTFTATGFLIAATKGWLKLDDPLKKYMPTFTVKSRFGADEVNKITFRHLLSHRSGLTGEPPVGNNFHDCSCTFEEHIKSASDTWLIAPVEERYRYANLGIDLAGYALGIRTRKPFEQFMKDELLTPLGMTSSTFDQKEALRNPSIARGHVAGREIPDTFFPMVPSGGLYSSANDMAKFVSFHLAGGKVKGRRLIAENFLKEMYTPQFAATKDEIYGYGLGIAAEVWRDATILHHGGGGYGYSTYLSWLPEHRIGVVVLANAWRSNDNLPPEISNQALLMMSQAKYGSTLLDKPLAPSGGPIVSLQAEQLRCLEGTYLNTGSVETFKVEEGALFYIRGGSKVKLNAHSATKFTSNIHTFNFHLDGAGQVTGVLVQGWRNVGIFMSINDRPNDPPGPNRPEWQAYVGEYTGKLWGSTIPRGVSVSIKNGYLYVKRDGWLKLTEYEPGLFFSSDGESVLFQGDRMLIANRPYVKNENN